VKIQLTRKSASFFAVAVLTLASAGPALADTSDTDSSNVDAKLLTALTITNTQGLNFGTLYVKFPLAADVTVALDENLNSAAIITSSDPVNVFPSSGELEAIFTVTGEAGETVVVTPPASPIDLVDGTNHVFVTLPTISVHNDSATELIGTPAAGQFIVPGDGGAKLEVGGTLTVKGTGTLTVAGTYAGSFDVTVDYL